VPGEYVVYAFLGATGIRRYQVVQKQLDAFEILIVPDAGFDAGIIEHVRSELVKVVGDSVALNFRLTDEIPLTPSGKQRVTVSELGG
jgi:phenylacetate-CoA ligase